MRDRLVRLAASGGLAVALAAIPGCGGSGGGDTSACNSIRNTIVNLSAQAETQKADPVAMGKVYTDAADKIRAEAKGGDARLSSAAGQAADVMDTLGRTLAQSPSGTGQPTIPEMDKVTQTTEKLHNICGD